MTTPDIFVCRALHETTAEHVTLFAGDLGNFDQIRKILRALPLPDHRLDVLADRLARLEPCPFAGEVTQDQVKVCLGEHDIWPNNIRDDVLLANYEDHLTRH